MLAALFMQVVPVCFLGWCVSPQATVAVPQPIPVVITSTASTTATTPLTLTIPVTPTSALTETVAVPVVAMDRTLSVSELWPGWAESDGRFAIPDGFVTWVTTDPGSLLVEGKIVLTWGTRAVLILPAGEYNLLTSTAADGSMHAWLEAAPSDVFSMDSANYQAASMPDAEGDPAPIYDLR